MKLHALLVVLFLVGCTHPPSPAPRPDLKVDLAAPGGVAACSATTVETPEGVCAGYFTVAPLCVNHTKCACIVCQGGQACVDPSTQVYCVKGGCAVDPACQYRAPQMMTPHKANTAK